MTAPTITRSRLREVVETAYGGGWVVWPDRPPPAVARVVGTTQEVSVGNSLVVGGPGCVLEQAYGGEWLGKGPAISIDEELMRAVGVASVPAGETFVVQVVDG